MLRGEKPGREEDGKHQSPGDEEGHPVAEEAGQGSTEQWADQVTSHPGSGHGGHDPTGTLVRCFAGHHRRGVVDVPGEDPLEETHADDHPDALGEPGDEDGAGHHPGRPHAHQLPALSIGQAAPEWGDDRLTDESHGEGQAGIEVQLKATEVAELIDEE